MTILHYYFRHLYRHISTRLYLPNLYICDTRQPADCFRFWFSSIHDRRASFEIPFQTTRFFLLEIYYCRTYYYIAKLLLLSLPIYVYTSVVAYSIIYTLYYR